MQIYRVLKQSTFMKRRKKQKKAAGVSHGTQVVKQKNSALNSGLDIDGGMGKVT